MWDIAVFRRCVFPPCRARGPGRTLHTSCHTPEASNYFADHEMCYSEFVVPGMPVGGSGGWRLADHPWDGGTAKGLVAVTPLCTHVLAGNRPVLLVHNCRSSVLPLAGTQSLSADGSSNCRNAPAPAKTPRACTGSTLRVSRSAPVGSMWQLEVNSGKADKEQQQQQQQQQQRQQQRPLRHGQPGVFAWQRNGRGGEAARRRGAIAA